MRDFSNGAWATVGRIRTSVLGKGQARSDYGPTMRYKVIRHLLIRSFVKPTEKIITFCRNHVTGARKRNFLQRCPYHLWDRDYSDDFMQLRLLFTVFATPWGSGLPTRGSRS